MQFVFFFFRTGTVCRGEHCLEKRIKNETRKSIVEVF